MCRSVKVIIPCLVLLATVGIFAGCEDPAANKPAAIIGESIGADASDAKEAAPAGETLVLAFTANTKVGFTGSKVTGSHDGGFNSVSGSVTLHGDELTHAVIEVNIDMNSIWSDTGRLTGHLKSADFFDVENHPDAKFKSTAIKKTDGGYDISGDFKLHGVTKNITFPASISITDGVFTAEAEFSINRMDFGIVYPGKANDLIRELVVLRLNIEATEAS